MKSKKLFFPLCFLLSFTLLNNCSSSDDSDNIIENPAISKQYPINSVPGSSISGTAKIIKNVDASITIEIQLNGTTSGIEYPAGIHYNSAAEVGEVAKPLNPVNGSTGFSTTTITTLEEGTNLTYEELIGFDGHINISLMENGSLTIKSQGDIGQNELTAISKVYILSSANASGIDGTLTFTKRINGNALAVIDLNGTTADNLYPAHIHAGNISQGSNVFITFSKVDGTTGISHTNIDSSDGVEIVGYDDLMVFDGYLDIHAGENDETVVANGNIGLL